MTSADFNDCNQNGRRKNVDAMSTYSSVSPVTSICSSLLPHPAPENVDVVLPVVVACFVALLGVISLVTYLATKKSVKRKIRLRIDGSASFSEPTSQESQKSTKVRLTNTVYIRVCIF